MTLANEIREIAYQVFDGSMYRMKMKDRLEAIADELDSTCKWKEVDAGIYETGCSQTQCFGADGIKENEYKHCPYCGKGIEEENNETSK